MNQIVRIPQPLSVYFAGKVAAGDGRATTWRSMFLNYGSKKHGEANAGDLGEAIFDTLELDDGEISCVPWTYAGPFYDAQHWHLQDDSKEIIFHRNMEFIRKCNMFFAFIDSNDCFGTLAEIGYAHALGKRVYIVFDHSMRYVLHDYWFVSRCAVQTEIRNNGHQLVRTFKEFLAHAEEHRVREAKWAAERQQFLNK